MGSKTARRGGRFGGRRRKAGTATAVLRDVPQPGPGRRDKDQCAPGRGPHTPVIVFAPMDSARCHQPGWWPEIGWMCWHEERCARCGKVLRRQISETECPGWDPGEARPGELAAHC